MTTKRDNVRTAAKVISQRPNRSLMKTANRIYNILSQVHPDADADELITRTQRDLLKKQDRGCWVCNGCYFCE